jgi:hypothetical protein
MKYDEVPSGRYDARPLRARSALSTQKQTPYFEVEFHIVEVDATLRWQGYLTDKTKARTLDAMALIDWNGDVDFKDGSINTGKDVSITVIREMGTDGKERPRVQWVNAIGGGSKFEGLEPTEAKSVFAQLNLKAEMAEARKRVGGGPAPKPALKNFAPGAEDDSDIMPF